MKSNSKILISAVIAIVLIAALIFLYVPLEAVVTPPATYERVQLTNSTFYNDIMPHRYQDKTTFIRQNLSTSKYQIWVYDHTTKTEQRVDNYDTFLTSTAQPRIWGDVVVWGNVTGISWVNMTSGARGSYGIGGHINDWDVWNDMIVFSMPYIGVSGILDVLAINLKVSPVPILISQDTGGSYGWVGCDVAIDDGIIAWVNNSVTTLVPTIYWAYASNGTIINIMTASADLAQQDIEIDGNITVFDGLLGAGAQYVFDQSGTPTRFNTTYAPGVDRISLHGSTAAIERSTTPETIQVYDMTTLDFYIIPGIAAPTLGFYGTTVWGDEIVYSYNGNGGYYDLYSYEDTSVPSTQAGTNPGTNPPQTNWYLMVVVLIAAIIASVVSIYFYMNRTPAQLPSREIGYNYPPQRPRNRQRKRG